MTSLLFVISLSALLSTLSLLVVLFRVSPLLSPAQAIPAFLISMLLAVGSVGTLLFYFLWTHWHIHTWDTGKLISVSLRQGILLAFATTCMLVFGLLGILSWWTGLLIYAVFVLIEVALNS